MRPLAERAYTVRLHINEVESYISPRPRNKRIDDLLLKPWAVRVSMSYQVRTTVVLIVEDEELLRSHAVEVVEEAGFTVLGAANADDAIAILEMRSDIGVLFTDIQMPGSIDGLKLAHAVRNRWPPIKIIIASGRVQPPDGDMPAGSRFFYKPYSPEKLTSVLTELAA